MRNEGLRLSLIPHSSFLIPHSWSLPSGSVAPRIIVQPDVAHLDLPGGWVAGGEGQRAALERLEQHSAVLPADAHGDPDRLHDRIAEGKERVEELILAIAAVHVDRPALVHKGQEH